MNCPCKSIAHDYWKVSLTCSGIDAILKMESKLSITNPLAELVLLKNRLGSLRKQKGMTQEELADKLEVSRQTIGSLESGRYNPSILLAFKIAGLFNLSIEDIFIYEESAGDER